ncbi:cytochrome c oxidase subunit 6C-1-like [Tachypleus tridentatus]|uniref:cytochrome c oxidase subunit 6C-1-like n=1 Tax=Tachypleus tridentatus TaxID=6853 RepID=UPI003FD1F0C5
MSAELQKISKPQLRGLLRSSLRKHLAIVGVLSISAALAWKYTVAESRKKRYAEFYKNYDAEKDFERMRQAGVFQSCRPDGE